MLWCGDYNRHHPAWDDPNLTHLFTSSAIQDSLILICLLHRFGLIMILPLDTPTFKSNQNNWTCPDNVFLTSHSEDLVLSCDVAPELQPNGADHIPIITTLLLPTVHRNPTLRFNFRLTDDKKFSKHLAGELDKIPQPHQMDTVDEMERAALNLIEAVQQTIEAVVPKSSPCPLSRCWWTWKLSGMKKHLSHLNNEAYKFRALPGHQIHTELKDHKAKYRAQIFQTKEEHWKDFLESVNQDSIFAAAKYASTPSLDSDKATQVPTLEMRDRSGNIMKAETDEQKAKFFAETFFTPAPPHDP
ncbi:hypothetical protein D9758_016069 [Tetrapyrgos nigripes]|uniref:Endonuclease/exonuclease/phosphatase domain-containing protein n=1 Tax=Tetrapyrgos nigripes TaxID=182062 RepID=A0A8H5C2S2_9AGAR|nr:hypothetical protein D9758_016069 [Tetrapyrgos nigripes]